jgi:hypothetical protein
MPRSHWLSPRKLKRWNHVGLLRSTILVLECALLLLVSCASHITPRAPAMRNTASVRGVLTSEHGSVLAGEEVMACTEDACSLATTDPSGRFSFVLEAPARIVLKTHEKLDTPPRAALMLPLSLPPGGLVDLGRVSVTVVVEDELTRGRNE